LADVGVTSILMVCQHSNLRAAGKTRHAHPGCVDYSGCPCLLVCAPVPDFPPTPPPPHPAPPAPNASQRRCACAETLGPAVVAALKRTTPQPAAMLGCFKRHTHCAQCNAYSLQHHPCYSFTHCDASQQHPAASCTARPSCPGAACGIPGRRRPAHGVQHEMGHPGGPGPAGPQSSLWALAALQCRCPAGAMPGVCTMQTCTAVVSVSAAWGTVAASELLDRASSVVSVPGVH
jgi:hypothetical protein